MVVRPAKAGDAPELARMRLALQEHMQTSNSRLLPMSRQAISNLAERYRSHLEDPNRQILVVEDRSGILIGMAMGTVAERDDLHPSRCGRIDDAWIKPEHRRQRLGKRLIGDLLAFFERKEVATLVLNYSVGNVEAEGTWKALGFEPILTVAVARPSELRQKLEK